MAVCSHRLLININDVYIFRLGFDSAKPSRQHLWSSLLSSLIYSHYTNVNLYDLAIHSWRDPDNITIQSCNGTRIASFPLGFVRRGGDNTWRCILDVVCDLVEHHGSHSPILTDEHGQPLDLDSDVVAGVFVYGQLGK